MEGEDSEHSTETFEDWIVRQGQYGSIVKTP